MMATTVYYLDTETTGFDKSDQVIQIAVIDQSGQTVLSSLLDTEHPIHPKAQEVHCISKQVLAGAPRWPDIHDQVAAFLANPNIQVKAYNAAFDLRLMLQTALAYDMTIPVLKADCVMQAFANRYNAGTWVKLTEACRQLGVEVSDLSAHDALADAEMTRRLDLAMKKEDQEF